MKRLRPISPNSWQPTTAEPWTEPVSVAKLPKLPLRGISAWTTSTSLLKLSPLETSDGRVLDFDIETVAAGFADPEWVPQKITCVAWSWVGEDRVDSRVCGPAGIFGKPELRRWMLAGLLAQIQQADVLTGHNILRFDLPIINAEAMRLELEPLGSVMVQDTMRVPRAKGFKKGQDVLGSLFGVEDEKMALDWQAWQDAYDEDGWSTIRQRCMGDVRQHKQIRQVMLDRGLLAAPRRWGR